MPQNQNPMTAVPRKTRMHPRRVKGAVKSVTGTRIRPCFLRHAERELNFVRGLVDTASQIVETIWPLSRDTMTLSTTVLPVRTFIEKTVRHSHSSCDTLQLALYYLIKIKPQIYINRFSKEQYRDRSQLRALQCGHRMFLAALILASKYLHDRTYSARTWSRVSGLNMLKINEDELVFLQTINWQLYISGSTFQRWTDLVLKLTPRVGSRPIGEDQSWRTVLPSLTPELESIEPEQPITSVPAES